MGGCLVQPPIPKTREVENEAARAGSRPYRQPGHGVPGHTVSGTLSREPYIPALRFRWLTRFFDPLMATLFDEAPLRERLIAQARIEPGHRVLDLGCGTGTLLVQLERRHPGTVAVGLDADPDVLALARTKAADAHLDIEFVHGLGSAPPLEAERFDRVLSSLFFHHLGPEDKRRTFAAAWKLLKAGGEIHVMDWGQPASIPMRAAFLGVQLLDGFATTRDNVAGRLPAFLEEAGFADVAEAGRANTIFGTLSFYRGRKE